MEQSSGIKLILHQMDISNNKAVYHNAKLLLKIYASAVWNTRDAVDELLCSHSETYQSSDIAALECLVTMYDDNSVKQLENKLRCVAQNKIIIDIVERNMLHLREYPFHGELYYTILNKSFFVKYPYTESEILESLNLSRSTYYRHRKDAVTTFGVRCGDMCSPMC